MKKVHIKYWMPAMFIMAGFLLSCVNDMEQIKKVTYDPKAPDQTTHDLDMMITDSGYAQVRIKATLAELYTTPKEVTKLKEGLQVDFFSEEGKVISSLTAQTGEVDMSKGLFVVRDSVVLYNYEKSQFLETEELFYNQTDSTIYTNKNVVVKKKGKGVEGRGQGIRTTQTFNKYTILKPVGKLDK